jgi:hypothetical protein
MELNNLLAPPFQPTPSMLLRGQLLGEGRRPATRTLLVRPYAILGWMKYLLVAFCLLSLTLRAQQSSIPPPASPVKYCLLYTLGSSFYASSVRLDYGQNQRKKRVVADSSLAALAAAIEEFTSVPAALSYLDSQGWELVQAATLPDDKTGQIGYLLRRRP